MIGDEADCVNRKSGSVGEQKLDNGLI